MFVPRNKNINTWIQQLACKSCLWAIILLFQGGSCSRCEENEIVSPMIQMHDWKQVALVHKFQSNAIQKCWICLVWRFFPAFHRLFTELYYFSFGNTCGFICPPLVPNLFIGNNPLNTFAITRCPVHDYETFPWHTHAYLAIQPNPNSLKIWKKPRYIIICRQVLTVPGFWFASSGHMRFVSATVREHLLSSISHWQSFFYSGMCPKTFPLWFPLWEVSRWNYW